MRRIQRIDLPAEVAAHLAKLQMDFDARRENGQEDATSAWKREQQRKPLRLVRATLSTMTGDRERCMYCLDSHGTDIDHFWPKARYPQHLFRWLNLLLGCAECGRFKGSTFPLDDGGKPLLLDPTVDDPWQHLDFDPDTGIITAAFDPINDRFEPRGVETVAVLQLDQREVLQRGYRRTFLRLAKVVQEALAVRPFDATTLVASLRAEDEHGLLAWCFSPRGGRVPPFADLRASNPAAFAECARLAESPCDDAPRR